jgi:DNA-directed RNA polymerase specialized sigma24 family protein
LHEDGRYADPVVDWSTELDDPALQTELRRALTAALKEVPDHYRAVIVLRDVEGLSMVEVAGGLGITVRTAKARAHRARLLVRQRLAGFMSRATADGRDGLLRSMGRKWLRERQSCHTLMCRGSALGV